MQKKVGNSRYLEKSTISSYLKTCETTTLFISSRRVALQKLSLTSMKEVLRKRKAFLKEARAHLGQAGKQ